MRFFGFGRKRTPDKARLCMSPTNSEERPPMPHLIETSLSTAPVMGHAAGRYVP